MIEKARKFSKLFNSLNRLNELLRRDYHAFLKREELSSNSSHEQYVESATDRLKAELRAICRAIRVKSLLDYQRVKPDIYILYLLFKYLRKQSNTLLQECKQELAHLSDEMNLDVAKDFYLSQNKSEQEATILASRDVESSAIEYQFAEKVLLSFLKKSKVIINDVYEDFSASNAFLLEDVSKQALEIDSATARIGRLLQLPDDKFSKAITNAEFGNPEDGRYKKYKKPQLTVEQVIILFLALKDTQGISPHVGKQALSYHLARITNHSENTLAQGVSKFEEILNEHKRGHDAYNGYTVIEYLNKVIKWIDDKIDK
ncbi:hypothetical protein [Pontibacter amylolyticus]|uniref:Uncharacterized protein n=1 Tax=Pontibacter amylolyticus TaxID=1424080 RepID=A0ABQ1W6Z0_9BACT|nr:hypothetical protein [Pontibacter amylolyticus]GGG18178.1 hypothetical protein GCM10011323_22990 [Pontibacter amylolyticus]